MDNLKEMTNSELKNSLVLKNMDFTSIDFRITKIEEEIAKCNADIAALEDIVWNNKIDLDQELDELETVSDIIFKIETEIRYREDNQIYKKSTEELEELGQGKFDFDNRATA